MLKKLDYSVTFPKTNRTLSEAVQFQGGFGAITGPNESGKSMIVEMVRFCLFGSAALRGRSEDYKTLKASLEFEIKGKEYKVERTSTKATLSTGGEIVTVGIKPVGFKIASLLGFGLDVFDMSCVANQDKLTELGDMQPTDRRRRVDSVIGVAVLDDLSKMANDEANTFKRTADELANTAREPTAPVRPDDYQPTAKLIEARDKMEEIRSQADQLRGWLAIEKKEPATPSTTVSMNTSAIQELLDQQSERRVQRQSLEAELARIPPAANITLEEIEADEARARELDRYKARRQFLTYNRKVEWDQAHIDKLWDDLKIRARWLEYQSLKKQHDGLVAQGEHTCPSCQHHWPVAGEAVSQLHQQIEAMEIGGVPREIHLNGLTPELVDGYQRQLDAWKRVEEEWETVHSLAPDAAPEVTMTTQDRIRHRMGLEGKARRAELTAQIEALKPADKEPDYAGMLRDRQQYEAQLAVYGAQLEEFEAWKKERGQKMLQLAMLDVDLQGYPDLIQALDRARAYEHMLEVFQQQMDDYNRLAGQIAAYRADAEDWRKVKDALQILRSKVKQYLVPSLNRVASSLIYHMTGGQRQAIVVDEDFNITVDGQEINTLSGSGKAVANLALRIGLGQVLTNNIFSLFMGDEIDASMDKVRAENTASVLRTLASKVSQLLLVSHKYPAADYYIAVGEQSEDHIVHTH